MKMNSTDTIIDFDCIVDVHVYRKKPTKEDKALAKKLSEQGKDLFIQMLTFYANKGDKKYEAYEHKKGNFALRELK